MNIEGSNNEANESYYSKVPENTLLSVFTAVRSRLFMLLLKYTKKENNKFFD